jgi:hypothetical protein
MQPFERTRPRRKIGQRDTPFQGVEDERRRAEYLIA